MKNAATIGNVLEKDVRSGNPDDSAVIAYKP